MARLLAALWIVCGMIGGLALAECDAQNRCMPGFADDLVTGEEVIPSIGTWIDPQTLQLKGVTYNARYPGLECEKIGQDCNESCKFCLMYDVDYYGNNPAKHMAFGWLDKSIACGGSEMDVMFPPTTNLSDPNWNGRYRIAAFGLLGQTCDTYSAPPGLPKPNHHQLIIDAYWENFASIYDVDEVWW